MNGLKQPLLMDSQWQTKNIGLIIGNLKWEKIESYHAKVYTLLYVVLWAAYYHDEYSLSSLHLQVDIGFKYVLSISTSKCNEMFIKKLFLD